MAIERRFCMELIREVFRLKWEKKQSNRLIGRLLRISKSTVATYLARADKASITTLEQLNSLGDDELGKIIFLNKYTDKKPIVDFKKIFIQSKRKNMTLMLLWKEELENNPSLYSYASFQRHYTQWLDKKKITMRQTHQAGEKGFIDYAGTTIPIINHKTGELDPSQIFVMSLGGTHYTYIEATWTQGTRDFLASNIHAFEFFGGVPEVLVPDNLKSAVTIASRYEPTINRSYRELASHYGTVVVPARVRRPQDKAIVENAVLNVSRQILARIRDRQFFSLEELNKALWELLDEYNSRKLQGMGESRKSLFEKVERDVLVPLPKKRFEIAEWKKAKANIDYHIALENNFYSVPYKFRCRELVVRYAPSCVEIFCENKRIAVHHRLVGEKKSSTNKEHMPVGHRAYAEWSPTRILSWAKKTGPSCEEICKRIMEQKEHPELGYRSCLGIIGLGNKYSTERLEMACLRALEIGGISFKSIQSILSKGLEAQPLQQDLGLQEIKHDNIRGSDYYQ